MTILGDGLTRADKVIAKFHKSRQQRLCERYASMCPERFSLILRRNEKWKDVYGWEYLVEAWNTMKYPGKHCNTSDDLQFGEGISISDAFSDFARNILKYEKCDDWKDLNEKMKEWEKQK